MKAVKKEIKILCAFKLLFLSILLLLSGGMSLAQSDDGPDIDMGTGKMKKRAANAIKAGDIYTSLYYYQQVVKTEPKNMEARYQLAEMHRLSRNYSKAEEAYAFVLDSAGKQYPFALFYKAQMQKMGGKYEKAKENLLKFKKEYRNLGDKDFKRMVALEISGCDSGMVFREFPENIILQNAGKSVNHPHTEFSPLFIDSSTMIFGSLREDSLKYYHLEDEFKETQPLRQVYKANMENGKWEEKGKFPPFNDPEMEMGNFTYSSLSGKYYFSKCTKNSHGHVTCKIYSTENVNGKWSKPTLLPSPVNTEGFTSTQPAIMFDTLKVAAADNTSDTTKGVGQPPQPTQKHTKQVVKRKPIPARKATSKPNTTEYLYFVSDRPKGKGGLDIWYSYINNKTKEWIEPVNASGMNTPETECTPYYHVPSQTFYFSSDGMASSGGLDIYKVSKQGKRFTKPQNLAFPLNSPQDELGFSLGEDGRKGFLVSNRPGGTPFFHETCCDDIFAFEILPYKPFKCTLDLTIAGTDTCRSQLLKVIAYDIKEMKESVDTVRILDCKFSLPLKPRYKYLLIADREGFQKDTLKIETRDMSGEDVLERKLVMKPEVKDKQPVVKEKPVEGTAFVLNDIQYETNETTLNGEAATAIDSLLIPFLKLHPGDNVFISSHTDDHGSHRYNMNLSQERADNLLKYIVSKGIDARRVHARGYGETKPVAPNKDAEGKDNPMGRSLNRRTEVLLVKP